MERRYTQDEVEEAMEYEVVFMGCPEDSLPMLIIIAALQDEVKALREKTQRSFT